MKFAASSSEKPSAFTSLPSEYFTGISAVERIKLADIGAYFSLSSVTFTV